VIEFDFILATLKSDADDLGKADMQRFVAAVEAMRANGIVWQYADEAPPHDEAVLARYGGETGPAYGIAIYNRDGWFGEDQFLDETPEAWARIAVPTPSSGPNGDQLLMPGTFRWRPGMIDQEGSIVLEVDELGPKVWSTRTPDGCWGIVERDQILQFGTAYATRKEDERARLIEVWKAAVAVIRG